MFFSYFQVLKYLFSAKKSPYNSSCNLMPIDNTYAHMDSQVPCNNSVTSMLASTTLKYMGESIYPSLLPLPAWFITI